jgi:pentatricopeptide repeat protein
LTSTREEGEGLMEEMDRRRLIPDAQGGVAAAIECLCRGGKVDDAERRLRRLIESGVAVGAFAFTSLITSYARLARSDKALALLDEMEDSVTGADAVAYTAALMACDREEDGCAVMDRARGNGWGSDEGLNMVYLRFCARVDRVDLAEEHLVRLEAEGVPTTPARYSVVIQAYARGGRWEEGFALLERTKALGVRHEVGDVTTVMTACGKAGVWEGAVRLLDGLRSDPTGPKPDLVAFNSALAAIAEAAGS